MNNYTIFYESADGTTDASIDIQADSYDDAKYIAIDIEREQGVAVTEIEQY